MEAHELKQLHVLLQRFEKMEVPSHRTTLLAGRHHDMAMAQQMQSLLLAYGVTFRLKLTLDNGDITYRSGFYSHDAAAQVGKDLLNTQGEKFGEGHEFPSPVYSFEVE